MAIEEKRVSATQDKLLKLQEKVNNNPPKTLIGKQLLLTRINRLSNVVDRKLLKIEAKNAAQIDSDHATDDYRDNTLSTMEEIAKVLLEKEDIEREIRDLERLDPRTGSEFKKMRRDMERNTPRGYVPREERIGASQDESNTVEYVKPEKESVIGERIAALRTRQEELEIEEATLRENIDLIKEKYQEEIRSIKEQKKENLALVATHPVRDMVANTRGFFQGVGERFNKWNEERKEKKAEKLALADEKLKEAATNPASAADKKDFRQDVKLSPEEEKKYAQEIQERFDKMKEEQQTEKENPSKEEADKEKSSDEEPEL